MTAHHFHASCVLLPDLAAGGVLITGPAQAGKSSLALQLLEAGGKLVSDDQTLVRPAPQGLIASAPDGLAGLLEIHGYGIVQLPPEKIAAFAPLSLYIALIPHGQPLERLPEEPSQQVLATKIPRLALRPHDPAALAKIKAVFHYPLIDYTHV